MAPKRSLFRAVKLDQDNIPLDAYFIDSSAVVSRSLRDFMVFDRATYKEKKIDDSKERKFY